MGGPAVPFKTVGCKMNKKWSNVVVTERYGYARFGFGEGDEPDWVGDYLARVQRSANTSYHALLYGGEADHYRQGEMAPLLPDDVGIVNLFVDWRSGINPGKHIVANPDLAHNETVWQCANAFLRYGDRLEYIDDDVMALAIRFVRAREGKLRPAKRKWVKGYHRLSERMLKFVNDYDIKRLTLGDEHVNPKRYQTLLSHDTVWMIERRGNRDVSRSIFISLLISLMLMKTSGCDPFNQITKIGFYNPWAPNLYWSDLYFLEPVFHNDMVKTMYNHLMKEDKYDE